MSIAEEKRTYASTIHEIGDDLCGFASMYLLDSECVECRQKVEDTVFSLLDFDKPKVMVYGIYNSGKSTLINALMRQEIAEMADRPMTDRIAEYDHGDYVLVDSPGVDAPIEHEIVTNEYLNKCHIILFVVSSKGGFESKYNYERMAELIQRGIPFVIVLNDRGAQKELKKDADEETRKLVLAEHEFGLNSIQYKIIENLKKVTGDSNIASRYEVIVLNAKKALVGVLRGKEKLYESSKLPFLEQRIIQLMRQSNALQILRQPVTNLKDCFNFVEQCIREQMGIDTTSNLNEKLGNLRSAQTNLEDDIRISVHAAAQRYVDGVASHYASQNAESVESMMIDFYQEGADIYEQGMRALLGRLKAQFEDVSGMEEVFSDDVGHSLFMPQPLPYSDRNLNPKWEDLEKPLSMEYQKKKGFFKSRKKWEKEKKEELERQAELANDYEQNKMNEIIRLKQEARQSAESDLSEMEVRLQSLIRNEISMKFDEISGRIQNIASQNRALYEEGNQKLTELYQIRKRLEQLEVKLG